MADVMDEVGDLLDTIADLRVFRWATGDAYPPAAIVGYPEVINYDQTYVRGMDRYTLTVYVVVGRPTDRSTRDAIAQYADGSGAASVKAALEVEPHVAFDTLRVTSVTFDVITLGGTDYLAALFELDIAGSGA